MKDSTWDHVISLVIAFGFVVAIILLFAAAWVYADDAAPDPTIVEAREAGSTIGPYTDWERHTLAPADTPGEATLIHLGDFVWVRYVSGPQACVFTATPNAHDISQVDGGIGGGRECNGGARACGFYMPGYGGVYGASGRSCAGYAVPACSGWCQ